MTADAVAPLRRRGISIALVAVFTSLARDFFSARACRARESADLCGAALFPHIPKKRCRSDGFAVALIQVLCCLHRRLLQLQRETGRPTHNTATGAALTCCGWASTPAATLRGINVASALVALPPQLP